VGRKQVSTKKKLLGSKFCNKVMRWALFMKTKVKICAGFVLVLASVLIHKSGDEVSLVEQDTIEIDHQIFKKSLKLFFSFILCNFLVQTLQYLFVLPLQT
jgi:hypothetical protein